MENIPFCKRVVFWGQYGETCWFNAILMAVLYSQHSRNIVYQQSNHWDGRVQLFKLLKHVLKYKYLKTKNPEKDYEFFKEMRPEKILTILSKKHRKYLPTTFKYGYVSTLFVSKLYKILGVECLMFSLLDKKLYYDLANHPLNISASATGISYSFKYKTQQFIKSKLQRLRNPRVIIINIDQKKAKVDNLKQHYAAHPQYRIEDVDKSILDLESTIIYNGEEYVLDSIILPNWNVSQDVPGHTIAGITCKNERYVYNGWSRYTADATMTPANNMQKIPCEFMKYDWNQQQDKDFCISTKQCALDKATINDLDRRMCFSFSRGSRNLIYVKKSSLTNLDHLDLPYTPEHVAYGKARQSKCTEGKGITKRCQKPKKYKPCDKGKVRHPITNRCRKVRV